MGPQSAPSISIRAAGRFEILIFLILPTIQFRGIGFTIRTHVQCTGNPWVTLMQNIICIGIANCDFKEIQHWIMEDIKRIMRGQSAMATIAGIVKSLL